MRYPCFMDGLRAGCRLACITSVICGRCCPPLRDKCKALFDYGNIEALYLFKRRCHTRFFKPRSKSAPLRIVYGHREHC